MLTTAQTLAVAGILTAAVIVICGAIAELIRRASDWRPGRHAAPPTPPAPPTTPPQSPAPPDTDGGGRRRLADDWPKQVAPLGPEPVLVRRYVLPRALATGAGR